MNTISISTTNKFTETKTAKVIAGAFVFAMIISSVGLTLANHNDGGAGQRIDTGWINASNFVGQVDDICGISAGGVYGQHGLQFNIPSPNIPAGNYSIDIVAHYGYYEGDPEAPQNNETMRVSSSADSRAINDLNGSGGSRPDRDDCGQILSGFSTYSNITQTPIRYEGGLFTFAGLTSNSQSISIRSVRIHGQSDVRLRVLGTVFIDANRNGNFDPGENVVPNRNVTLLNRDNNQTLNNNTSGGGSYLFNNLNPGNYRVAHAVPSGFERTTDDSVPFTITNSDFRHDFGIVQTVVTNPNLTIDKQVRNITQGQAFFSESVSANRNDLVEFRIVIRNTGNANANNVTYNDVLPSELIFVSGTLNSNFSNIAPGASENLTLTGRVSTPVVQATTLTLTNTANFASSNAGSGSDIARVVVTGTPRFRALGVVFIDANRDGIHNFGEQVVSNRIVSLTNRDNGQISQDVTNAAGSYLFNNLNPGNYRVAHAVPSGFERTTDDSVPFTITNSDFRHDFGIVQTVVTNPNLTIDKQVRNITQGQAFFSESVSGAPNDQFEFRIIVRSTGTAIVNNVFLTDVLPNNFTLISGLPGPNFGDMAPGISRTHNILVAANSASVFPIGSSSWTNTATADGSNVNPVSDTAGVVINRTPSGNPALSITKQVRNITQGQVIFSNSVSAVPNDQVEFRMVVRSIGNAAANDVVFSDILPNRLSATNGNPIVQLGDMAPNQTQVVLLPARVDSASSFPVGITLLENIGRVNAIGINQVQDSAFVSVSKTTTSPGAISLDKQVRNITQGQAFFGESVSANANDIVEFRIIIRNTGSSNANNVGFTDTLPANLNFVSGNTAINFSNIPSNGSETVILRAQVASGLPNGSTILTNIASVTSADAGSDSDTAQVVVNITPPVNPVLTVDKKVRNITQGQAFYSESVNASPNDQLDFQITIRNISTTTANNVVLSDVLPANFFLTSGQTNVNLGNISPNGSQIITIGARVGNEGSFPFGSSTHTNTATATATNTGSISDTAQIIVTRGNILPPPPPPPLPFLDITKEVRNTNSNSFFSSSTSANVGDQVEFRITLRNSSQTAQNVRVQDFLPAGLSFVQGSTKIDNLSAFSAINDMFIGSMFAGQTKTVIFSARVDSNIGSATLTNTANVSASNLGTRSASASVFVNGQLLGSNVDLVLSKNAFNVSQGRDATTVTARAGDMIDYTLRVTNRGNAASTNFVIEDNINDVLELATLINNGAGVNNNGILRWPGVSIASGQTIERIFSVKVKDPIPPGTDNVMSNTYGNTVNVPVGGVVAGVFTAPPTGSANTLSLIFATLSMVGAYGVRRYKLKGKGA